MKYAIGVGGFVGARTETVPAALNDPPGVAHITPLTIYIDNVRLVSDLATLDIDGNGMSDSLTDGVLVLRYMFGFRGIGAGEWSRRPGRLRPLHRAGDRGLPRPADLSRAAPGECRPLW